MAIEKESMTSVQSEYIHIELLTNKNEYGCGKNLPGNFSQVTDKPIRKIINNNFTLN